jgi:Acetyl-CoA hydrolase
MKRNERIGAIILTLSESPSKVFSLQQFCDAFGVAKSSISEDIAIASEAVKATGSGYIETIPGAKGGVRFIPDIQDDELEKLQIEFCDRISDSSRILGGGFLYTSDIMFDTDLVSRLARIFVRKFKYCGANYVATVETKGIILASMVARQLDLPLVIIRREAKVSEGSTVSINYFSGSYDRVQKMSIAKRAVEPGSSALIIDDFMHDVIILDNPPHRQPIGITKPSDRIGKPYMECGWDKIAGIVITDIQDGLRPLGEISEDSQKIADNIIEFLNGEVKAGRLSDTLLPIQSGVGSVANAVLYGLLESDFHDLTCYTEVVQDSMLELIKAGKVVCASTTAITPSPEMKERFDKECEMYRGKLIFRPEDISNNPEVIRRLGVIAMNTALEADIYGNVNSTHVNGSSMMNGIGGSGDFSRNGAITIFSTVSTAKGGKISSIVPMCSHVDHTEHDVMVIVTEQGYADLRGCSPKERANKIINNCVHPDYKDQLMDYYQRACKESALQTPHILSEALSWHINYMKNGTMKL